MPSIRNAQTQLDNEDNDNYISCKERGKNLLNE